MHGRRHPVKAQTTTWVQPIDGPTPMGHEYCGIVEEVGRAVTSVRPGQFVVGSLAISDNTCPHCQYGCHSSCTYREFMSQAQAPVRRVPLADGYRAMDERRAIKAFLRP